MITAIPRTWAGPSRRPTRRCLEKNIYEVYKPSGTSWRRVYEVQMKKGPLRRAVHLDTYEEARATKARWLANGIPVRDAAPIATLVPDHPATVDDGLRLYGVDLASRGAPSADQIKSLRSVVAAILPGLSAKPLSHVTPADIFAYARARAETPPVQAWRAKRQVKVNPSTIAHELTGLRAMLRSHLGPKFDFPAKAIPKPNNLRYRVLEPDELRRARVVARRRNH